MNKFSITCIAREIADLFVNWFSFNKKEWAWCPIERDYRN